MSASTNRRVFLKSSAAFLGSCALAACNKNTSAGDSSKKEPGSKISLAQWSLHRALKAGELDNLDFPRIAREDFGFDGIEWSSQFAFVEHPRLGSQPKDQAYLTETKRVTDDHGLTNLLIMCDHVGNLGDPDNSLRSNAVEGHYAWVEAAKLLGCHSIRVNAASDQSLSSEEQKKLCIDGLGRLCTFAQTHGLPKFSCRKFVSQYKHSPSKLGEVLHRFGCPDADEVAQKMHGEVSYSNFKLNG